MSALAACTSPSGHALHTKGWGSILLPHIFCSHYPALVLAPVFPICEAAKRIQQLTSYLPQPSPRALEQGAAFLHHGNFYVFAAFCAGLKAGFSLYSGWTGKDFPKKVYATLTWVPQQPPSCWHPLDCTTYKRCANRLKWKWSVAHTYV